MSFLSTSITGVCCMWAMTVCLLPSPSPKINSDVDQDTAATIATVPLDTRGNLPDGLVSKSVDSTMMRDDTRDLEVCDSNGHQGIGKGTMIPMSCDCNGHHDHQWEARYLEVCDSNGRHGHSFQWCTLDAPDRQGNMHSGLNSQNVSTSVVFADRTYLDFLQSTWIASLLIVLALVVLVLACKSCCRKYMSRIILPSTAACANHIDTTWNDWTTDVEDGAGFAMDGIDADLDVSRPKSPDSARQNRAPLMIHFPAHDANVRSLEVFDMATSPVSPDQGFGCCAGRSWSFAFLQI